MKLKREKKTTVRISNIKAEHHLKRVFFHSFQTIFLCYQQQQQQKELEKKRGAKKN